MERSDTSDYIKECYKGSVSLQHRDVQDLITFTLMFHFNRFWVFSYLHLICVFFKFLQVSTFKQFLFLQIFDMTGVGKAQIYIFIFIDF